MKKVSRFLILAFVLIFAVVGCIPATAGNATSKTIIENVIDFNLKVSGSINVQNWIDGYLSENASAGTEWYIIALSKYGKYDFTSYKKALNEYLSENEIGSASSRLKFALALVATGEKNSEFITDFLENSVGEQGIMSLIFGLHILNNNYSCKKYSLKSLTDELISLQSADGGWSLTGTNSDVDITAMTVQALAPQYNTNSAVRKTIDEAVVFLSLRQNENGTYSSYGVSNPESISQVIIALSALGIDSEKDERFIKNSKNLFDALESFRSADGGYFHQYGKGTDPTATVQVFCAAVAYKNMKDGESPFYIFGQKENATSSGQKEEAVTTTTAKKTENIEKIVTQETEQTSSLTEKEEIISVSTQTVTSFEENEDNNKSYTSYKIWIISATILFTVCLCAVLLMTKRINRRSFVVIMLAAICAILVVIFSNIKSDKNKDLSADGNSAMGTVTISIRCDTIKDAKNDLIPENGVILGETEIQIDADDTVYDVLLKACKENGIHFETTGVTETLYIEGIGNIYEKDYGDLSGWMYFVNGKSPSVGCGKYKLSDKDEIVWCYTCEMGADLNY